MNDNNERFSGDMSRNEVEIDLSKFMSMVSEIGELKQKIMELENDKAPDNPWQKWIWLSNMIDAWRIFPRAFLSVYIILLYKCTIWFMDLPAPTFEQSGLISVVEEQAQLGSVYMQEQLKIKLIVSKLWVKHLPL
tara:strand:+ start:700 stop:1104 length:405 start_codon:yes stop_codon:yes gene_type:complete